MSPILLLITALSLIIVGGILFKYELGIASYLVYLFCVPLVTLYVYSYQFGLNLIVFLSLFVYLIKYKSFNKEYTQHLYPFFFLYVALGLLIPIHIFDTPLGFQFDSWRYAIISLIIPLLIVNIQSGNDKVSKYINVAIYLSIFINTIYTLTLLGSFGVNPYIDDVISPLRKGSDKDLSFLEEEGIRLFGYVTACFRTVTAYGAFLIPVACLVFRDYLFKKSIVNITALVLIAISIMVCGSRSVLYTLIILVAFFLYLNHNYKILGYSTLILSVVVFLIYHFIPEYVNFIFSFNSTEIVGSTTDMRWDQYACAFDELIKDPLGKGYNWTNWYKVNYGAHPRMRGFESLPIQVLCENGIPGLIIWIVFGVMYVKRTYKNFAADKITRDTLLMLFVGYFVLTLFTGDYGGLHVVAVIYAIMVSKSNNTYTLNGK